MLIPSTRCPITNNNSYHCRQIATDMGFYRFWISSIPIQLRQVYGGNLTQLYKNILIGGNNQPHAMEKTRGDYVDDILSVHYLSKQSNGWDSMAVTTRSKKCLAVDLTTRVSKRFPEGTDRRWKRLPGIAGGQPNTKQKTNLLLLRLSLKETFLKLSFVNSLLFFFSTP